MATRNARMILSAQDRASKTIFGVSGALKGLGALAVAVGVTKIGKEMVRGVAEGVKVFKAFDQQMSTTAAVLGKTKDQIAALDKQAKTLGRTTQFTARETAEAQNILAKAGFSVNEIFSAIPGTLDLAAAGEISIGQAADVSAQLIRTFGLEASASTDVADLLAKAANTANTTVSELGDAFKFAGPAAKVLGASLDETAAAIQLVSDRGLKGSLAGTGLGKVMTTLLGQVNKLEGATGLSGLEEQLFRTDGSFIGLAATFKLLKENGIDSGDAFKIFGERAGKVAAIMLDNTDALEAATEALGIRKGFAKAVAEVKLDNLAGDTTKFNSAVEGLQLIIGEQLNESLRILVQQSTLLIQAFADSAEEGNFLIDVLAKVASAISSVGTIALGIADVVQITWAGMRIAFNTFVQAVIQGLADLSAASASIAETLAFTDAMEERAAGIRRTSEDFQFMADSFGDQSEDIWEAAGETSTRLDEIANSFAGITGKANEALAASVAAADAAATALEKKAEAGGGEPKTGPQFVSETGLAALDEAGGGDRIRTRFPALFAKVEADTAAHEARLTEIGLEAKLARADLEDAMSEERFQLQMEVTLERQAIELEALDGNLTEQDAMRQLFALKNQKREEQFTAKKNKMDELAKRRQTQQVGALVSESIAGLQTLFGENKAFSIASAIVNTAMAVTNALAVSPPWVGIALAIVMAVKGLAEIANIKKQKFAHGGIVQGIGGVDTVPAQLTPGELVLPTQGDQAELILESIASGGGIGGTTIVNNFIEGDVLDPDDYFQRMAQPIGRALEALADDGGAA